MYIHHMHMPDFSARAEYLCIVKLCSKTGHTNSKVLQILVIPIGRWVGLATDGKSSMTSIHIGLQAYLRKVSPLLSSTRCAAQKTA